VPTHSICSKRTQQFAHNALNLLKTHSICSKRTQFAHKLPRDVSGWLYTRILSVIFPFFCFRGRRERREGGARADTLTMLKLSKDVSGLLFSVLLFSYSFNFFPIFVLEEGLRGEREEEGDPRFRGRRMGFWKERLRPTFCQ
jgi:hypothetical protein